jgi:hypothetical protein
MFLQDPEAKPNGEAPGIVSTSALQDSKIAPSFANRGAHLPKRCGPSEVPHSARRPRSAAEWDGGGRLSKTVRPA